MNKVILMGRMVRDAELKQTASGTSVCSFSLAVNRRFKDKSGNYPCDFINCVAWRQTADFISKYFPKGSMIAICGSIQTRTYDDAQGAKHYVTEVIADESYFCGSKTQSAPQQNPNELPMANDATPKFAEQAQQQTAPFDIAGFTPFDDGSEDDLPF